MVVRSETICTLTDAGERGFQPGQFRLDPLDGGDDIRARLREDVEDDGRLLVEPAGKLRIGWSNARGCDVLEADRRVVAIGDHEILEGGARIELVVGRDTEGLARTPDRPLGCVQSGSLDGVTHVRHGQVAGAERCRIDFDPHGRLLLAADCDKADARKLGQATEQDALRIVIDRRERQCVRSDGEDQDGRVGGIGHAVTRRRDQRRRQVRLRRRECRLYLERGILGRDTRRKLECNLDKAQRAR